MIIITHSQIAIQLIKEIEILDEDKLYSIRLFAIDQTPLPGRLIARMIHCYLH